MRFGIIGAGLIGNRRAKVLPKGTLALVADIDRVRAEQLAKEHGCNATTRWEDVAFCRDIDAVFVCTTNNWLTPISIECLKHGKHVLVEKPAARSSAELLSLMRAQKRYAKIVKVGFNHRFHPALIKAKELFDSDAAGRLMYIRANYGHGGRLGYEREWRANPRISGGGELLDQGIHIIDLARWFAGDLSVEFGYAPTFFWKMPVEDNGFLCLKNNQGNIAWLHASCTQWKNQFLFEVFGETGLLRVEGIGRSYGTERLTFYKMKEEMGIPDTTTYEFPGEDPSWELEFKAFSEAIEDGSESEGNLNDAYATIRIVEAAYAQTKARRGAHSKVR